MPIFLCFMALAAAEPAATPFLANHPLKRELFKARTDQRALAGYTEAAAVTRFTNGPQDSNSPPLSGVAILRIVWPASATSPASLPPLACCPSPGGSGDRSSRTT